MIALNLFSTQDNYVEAGTRRQSGSVRLNLQVANAAVFVSMADDDAGQLFGGTYDEEFYPPGAYSINRRFGGARVRSAVAGSPAVVSFSLLQRSDLP